MEDLEVEIQREASPSCSPPQERASEPGPPSPPSPPSPLAGSAVHTLQTKVRAVSYRPGRRERRRDKRTSDIQPGGPGWSLVIPGEKARGKGRVNPPVSLKYPEFGAILSSSEEEEEDGELEVQVEVEVARLHLNTSPPDTAGEPEARNSRRGGESGSDGGPVRTASGQPVPPRGLGEGSSVENLQTDVSSSTTDGPSPSKPAPPSSSSLSFLMTSASSSSSSTTTSSSSSSRHWAPPKGFWRVVRPETLHLNGAEPLCAAASLPVKDYTLMSSLPVKDYTLMSSLPVKDYTLMSSLTVKDYRLL
ncbi:protein SOGA3-like [Hypomesus transpacificus]|uniref:protein SOGA3-like n=1 Tax=Hypomesus transpacificus TaxID=137520 RepID=UPI001F07CB95|nr:protein SOGA3-like [Hypomesus transpacificus]